MTEYIIVDDTNVNWPGRLPYRGRSSREGYATREEAEARMARVIAHYNAKHGRSPGQLRVVERPSRPKDAGPSTSAHVSCFGMFGKSLERLADLDGFIPIHKKARLRDFRYGDELPCNWPEWVEQCLSAVRRARTQIAEWREQG